jgi:hypothetical protein
MLLTFPTAAIFAYLDPGSGSFLIQLAVAAIVGLLVVLRLQWQKVKKFFGRGGSSEAEDDDDGQE